MNSYVGRQKDLAERLNIHLKNLTGYDIDFYSKLSITQVLDLKMTLSTINNILTLEMTKAAIKWLFDFHPILKNDEKSILERIDGIKPNAAGYDIYFPEYKIIGEVKCTIPVNNRERYGAKQWESILTDVQKMYKGKKQQKDTSEFFKFIFLLDLGVSTDKAIKDMARPATMAKPDSKHYERHKLRKYLIVINNETSFKDLQLKKVYLKKIKL